MHCPPFHPGCNRSAAIEHSCKGLGFACTQLTGPTRLALVEGAAVPLGPSGGGSNGVLVKGARGGSGPDADSGGCAAERAPGAGGGYTQRVAKYWHQR